MNINKKLIAILAVTVLTTAGCSAENAAQTETASDDTTVFQIETTAETEITQEEIKMERFNDMITELMPMEYEEVREGVGYSEFQKLTYFSETAGRETNVNVLLPPDYSEDKEYPVLYILHGFYDNEDWMTRSSVNLNVIYGNLLAEGKAEEMIIIMPYIFCDKNMPYCTGMDLANCYAYDNFINDLTTDLMPFIESSFSVAEGSENTAITGFSMGGRESLFIGFEHPELFGYIGAVCPAPGLVEIPNSPMHPGQMTADKMVFGDDKPYALLISSSNTDGVVGNSLNDYRSIMTENQVEYLSHIMKSTGHDHSSVKPHLYNFLQLLFK